jgi:predicted amidohydrolase
MPKLSISLAQMNIVAGDTRKNTATAEQMVIEAGATKRNSTIVVLPELWHSGYALHIAKDIASQLNGGVFAQVATWATQNKVCVVGSVLEKRGLEISNAAAFFAPNGRMLGVYRKIHLFRLMDEERYLQPGASPLIINAPWGDTALAICYDLRFPELFRRYAVGGAKVIIVPSEWPIERIDHWRQLMIARAIENQCYMIGCNAAGQCGDKVMGGHSMIVDPWGKIVLEVGENPTLATAEIDTDYVDAVRSKIPVFEDRRPDVY